MSMCVKLKHDTGVYSMGRLVYVLLVLAVTVPTLIKSRPGFHETPAPAFSVCSSGRITVSVDGEIRHPGVYTVSANSLANGVILLAEPLWIPETLEFSRNGRQRLNNGSALHVIHRSNNSHVVSIGSIPTAQRMILGIPLDIQSMNADDFDRLPAIGPVLAERIVMYRQQNGGKLAVSDLLSVEGIGEKKYSVLKKYF